MSSLPTLQGILTRRLIGTFAALTAALALAGAAIQLALDYRQGLAEVEERFELIRTGYLPSIIESVWVADRNQLRILVDSIANLPDIARVEVTGDSATLATAASDPAAERVTRHWPLVQQYRGRALTIGELKVEADLGAIRSRTVDRAVRAFLVNLVQIALVAALMFLVVRRLVTRRVEEIARHFGQAGPESLQAPLVVEQLPRGPDEIDQLVAGFNELRQKVASSYAELRELNASLEARVAERTAALESANRELGAFSFSVSHDLRAPLRAINGFARLLIDDERERLSEDGRHMLDQMTNAAKRLDRLIEDILQYSRAGQRPLERQPVNLAALARDVAQELRDPYPRTTVAIADDLPDADGDPVMLRQVLQNLIGNALKFTAKAPQPRIEVGWASEDGETVYSVRDNGAGFDMAYADKLFGMFQRLHSETDFPGTGVGLAIVKRLVERHGGRIWATGQPGAGATFSFTLGRA